jgi:hypothetical protein
LARRRITQPPPPVPSIDPVPPIDFGAIDSFIESLLIDFPGVGAVAGIAKPTRVIGFNYIGTVTNSWRADQDYWIVCVFGFGATNGAIVSLGGQTYAQLSSAGVHQDWVSYSGINTLFFCRERIAEGQLLYCSSTTTGATQVGLELVN